MSTQAIPAEYHLAAGELSQAPTAGRSRYFFFILLLASFYYTIPVIKTSYGYSTYLRLDDIVSIFFLLLSLGAIRHRYKLSATEYSAIVIIALLLMLPSTGWGYLLSGELKNLQRGFLQTIRYTRIFFIFLAVMVIPIDEKRFRKIMLIIWLGSVFVGIYGALQYFGVLSVQSFADKFAQSGPWKDVASFERVAIGPLSHNHACIGAYMVIAIFTTLFLSRTAWGGAKIVYLASIPFFMIVILWSKSRADFFGVFVGLLAYMILSKVRPAAIVGFAGAAAVTYIVLNIVPELRERFIIGKEESLEEFSSGRMVGWFNMLLYMCKRPYLFITGVGLGNFDAFFGQIGLIAAHNNYLHWLFECGIFGLIVTTTVLMKIRNVVKQLDYCGKFHHEISVCFLSLFYGLISVACTQELFTPNPALAAVPTYIVFVFGCVTALYRTTIINYQIYNYGYNDVIDENNGAYQA